MGFFTGCVADDLPSREGGPDTRDDEESAAVRAWARLSSALAKTTPPCDGDPEFTGGHLRAADRMILAAICATCPVLSLCREYADQARITFGFWGGSDRAMKQTTATGTASRQSNHQENRS